jgi:hypothetical protein
MLVDGVSGELGDERARCLMAVDSGAAAGSPLPRAARSPVQLGLSSLAAFFIAHSSVASSRWLVGYLS